LSGTQVTPKRSYQDQFARRFYRQGIPTELELRNMHLRYNQTAA